MNPLLHLERTGNDTATWLVQDKRSWLIIVVVFMVRASWRASLGAGLAALGDALWSAAAVGLAAAAVFLVRSFVTQRSA